jgi:hypothetical protein
VSPQNSVPVLQAKAQIKRNLQIGVPSGFSRTYAAAKAHMAKAQK